MYRPKTKTEKEVETLCSKPRQDTKSTKTSA
jgi:hypothetical protein